MLRNCLASAWRSAAQDRLHSAINILGLALGLAAAMLIALYVRHELSYDDFLAGSDRIYRVSAQMTIPGRPMAWYSDPPEHTRAPLLIDFPELAGAARLYPDQVGVRRGTVEANEAIDWADPGFLTVMGLATIAGDPATALDAPDSVVLTRSMARKYFGTDTPIGATLQFNRKDPMRVTAVIEDLPSNSHLAVNIIAGGRAATSPLTEEDQSVQVPGTTQFRGYLYVRLKPGISAEALEQHLPDFVARHFPPDPETPDDKSQLVLKLDPIRSLHLLPYVYDMKERGSPATLAAIGIIGVLVIAVASINFVNLMTARAARRALEIGVRKALGATRGQLTLQFMAEAVGFAALAALVAVAAVELALPGFNALIDRRIVFAWWRDPEVLLGLAALVLAVGAGAGLYPALVLARIEPAAALKSARAVAAGGGRLRQALVVLQFAVSIGLAVSTLVIRWQTDFATSQSLRFDKEQVALVRGPGACADSFRNEVSAVLGVRGVVCSRAAPLDFSSSDSTATLPDGRKVEMDVVDVDFGFFDFYGLKLLAGRSFDRAHGEDEVSQDATAPMQASVVINEAAVRAMGFASPAAAIGQTASISGVRETKHSSQIIGVVPDFPIGSIRRAVQPSAFYVDPAHWGLLAIRLDGARMPETLAEIDRLWSHSDVQAPLWRFFLDAEIDRQYRDVERQSRIFAGFSAVAIVIGCLGLFALSAFAAERRTKEIGIRKALGASTGDVAKLLIWQFAKPVLIANAIAWPVAWWLMQRWLEGFAYRIALGWLPFVAAGACALIIAVATTGFHALQAASSRPVTALRYE
jgi:putative ABC transport system permease protein